MPSTKNTKLSFKKETDKKINIDELEGRKKPDFAPYTNSFDKNQIKKLKLFAVQSDRTVKDLLHEALQEYIDRHIDI
ncbi:MAG TPA: hypothetical protein DDY13_06040 [Cytophagales bacterium]|jgi:hypothetical protein|nr:hypothetical protein [Cytophagales bacterium]